MRDISYRKIDKDNISLDAFDRLRVALPHTIFDSKLLYDAQPLFWDDQAVSGTGTSSTHSTATASSTLGVSASTAGVRTRQTFRRFNYQPGKSMCIIMTGVIGAGSTGITARIGYFDDNNGLFFENIDGVMNVVRRTKASGNVSNNKTAQSSWNLDKMDGTGPSGITLDFSKTQIFFIDFEWLGVGRVRFGFVVDGILIYCHELNHANSLTTVYMSTPNLPLRYELTNAGHGGAATLVHICSTVISEGGMQETGATFYVSTNGTHVDANAADTTYAVVGLRLKSTHLSVTTLIDRISILSETNDNFEWLLLLNPTVASVFTYSDIANSALQRALGATANTITGGTQLAGGWVNVTSTGGAITSSTPPLITLGSNIAGTADTLVLAVRPLSTNADIQGGILWRELV